MFKGLFSSLFRLILALAIIFIAWRFIWEPTKLRTGLAMALGVSDPSYQIFPLQPSRINELATLSQPIVIQSFGTKGPSFLQSRLNLQGRYNVKLGFNLSVNSSIVVDPLTRHAVIRLGKPKVLSVDFKGLDILQSEQAIWTAFTPEEQAAATVDMRNRAEQIASEPSILASALENAQLNLNAVARAYGATVDVVVDPEEE